MTDTQHDDDPYYFEINNACITINDDVWLGVDCLKNLIQPVLNEENISILLTSDGGIQKLNKNFRNQDKPTNVLSFPGDDGDDYLGDIAISFHTLEREAAEQEKSFDHHFIHILVHGLLHLKGYDHETDGEAEEMEALEIKILADLNIQNPYK